VSGAQNKPDNTYPHSDHNQIAAIATPKILNVNISSAWSFMVSARCSSGSQPCGMSSGETAVCPAASVDVVAVAFEGSEVSACDMMEVTSVVYTINNAVVL
jgi:hypothetical protein